MAATCLAALGTPVVGAAQTPRPVHKIGYLHTTTVHPSSPTLASMRPALQRLGYVAGETFLVRSADGDPRRLPVLAAELLGLGIGALIAVGPAAVRAASQAGTMPVVAIDLESDPVRAGFAASFSRPGGNITGLFLDQPSLASKWIELLHEAAPKLVRVGLVWDPGTTADQLDAARAAAHAKGLDPVTLELRASDDYETAFRGLSDPSRTGIVHLGAPGFIVRAAGFAVAAQRYMLPTIAFLKAYARAGLLMSFGPSQEVYFQRAVIMADRILKGERPGDLPIERADTFEFVINLGTARAIGLDIAPALLARADEVIE